MSEPVIVDRHGKAIQRKTLTQEVATPSLTGVRQAWQIDSVASGLTPMRLAGILQSANEGHDYDLLTLAEEMEEREMHYASVLQTRKLAIEGLPIHVKAADDSAQAKEHAEAIELLTKKPAFEELLSDLLDGLGKGRSTCEIQWAFGKTWEPDSYIWRDPRYFTYNPDDPRELRLIDESDTYKGLPLPSYKFVTHTPKLKSGLVTRSGLARLVSVSYMCKSFTLRDWMSFSELFGMPIRIGKYGQNASSDEKDILRRALANIGSDAAGLIPDSMQLEFIERTSGSGSGHQLFKDLAEWLDRQISKAVLGQTATTEGTPGKLGNDDAQDDVRRDLLRADAKQLARTLNRDLVKPYIDLNYGVQEQYPQISIPVTDPENLEILIKAVETLVPMGLRVKQSEMSNKFGLTQADDDDEVLTPASQAEPKPDETKLANNHQQACRHANTALNREVPPDDIDELIIEALDGWEPDLQPMLDPIQQLANDAQDEEEFLTRLPELLEQMDANELIKTLASASFKARAVGYGNG